MEESTLVEELKNVQAGQVLRLEFDKESLVSIDDFDELKDEDMIDIDEITYSRLFGLGLSGRWGKEGPVVEVTVAEEFDAKRFAEIMYLYLKSFNILTKSKVD